MILRWSCIILLLAFAVICGVSCKKPEKYSDYPKWMKIIGLFVCVICAGVIFWSTYFTEPGKRAQRDFKSETQSGYVQRELNVYDMEGDLVEHYEGKFDTEESVNEGSVKVKFDIDGERHIVYIMSGAVTINDIKEVDKNE